jgi:release factor glutamine methyltransferase
VQSDWGDGVTGTFDLILCNPPYVEAGADLPRDVAAFEPAEALYAGPEGLDDYRRIAPRIGGLLAPGGLACIEIGAGQAEAVTALFGAEGLAVSARADLAGIPRCLLVSR